MISSELLRRYPFFVGLSSDQLVALAMTADEYEFEAGHRFFNEGDTLVDFYLVIEGDVGISFKVPKKGVQQSVAGQLTGELETEDKVISHIGPGEPFGWTALAHGRTANNDAAVLAHSKIVVFNVERMREKFEEDPNLNVTMLRNILDTARQRLHDLRMECLSTS